jgi:hypothetical protein
VHCADSRFRRLRRHTDRRVGADLMCNSSSRRASCTPCRSRSSSDGRW